MTDVATTAAADAAPVSDAVVADASTLAEPSSQGQAAEPTARGAIERAFATLEAKEAGTTADKPAEQPTGDRPRNPDGTFAAKPSDQPVTTDKAAEPVKDTSPNAEPPTRFSADAKAAWKDTPEPVRSEMRRAVTELVQGIEGYKTSYEPYRELDKALRSNGQNPADVIAQYTGIERLLANNLTGGLDQICQNAGTSLREVAAKIMGQTPDQNASAQDATIRELRAEIASLKKGVEGVSTHIRTNAQQATMKEIEAFASSQPRFDELAPDIAFFIESGRAQTLEDAYKLAERLNPAPQPASPAAQAAPTPPAQTRVGQLSLSGAPSSGSNPANRKPPSTPREALDRAFASVGI